MFLVLIGAWLLFGAGGGARPYLVQDVSRYAQMAVEMRQGHTLVPTLHRVPYLEAMPLAAWTALAVAKVQGAVTPGTARLLPALGGIGMVLLTLLIALEYLSWRAALLATGIVALNPIMIMLARGSRVDTLLGLGVTAAACAAFHADRSEKLRWFVAAGVGLALGIAAKGPLACALLGLTLVPWLAWERRWRSLFLGGAITLLVAGILTAAWLIPYLEYAGETVSRKFLEVFLMKENFDKFSGHLTKNEPVWAYAQELAIRFAPWAPLSVWWCYRVLRRPRAQPPLLRLSAAWVVFPLILLSAASGKCSRYLVPLLPALSLLAAAGLDDLLGREVPERWIHRAFWVLGGLMLVGGLGGPVAVTVLGGGGATVWLTGLGAAAAGAYTLQALRREPGGDRPLAGLWVGAGCVLTFVYAGVMPLPALSHARGEVLLSRELRGFVSPRQPLTVVERRMTYELGAMDDVMLEMYLERPVGRARPDHAPARSLILAPAQEQDLRRGRHVLRKLSWEWHRGAVEPWVLLSEREEATAARPSSAGPALAASTSGS